MKLLLCVLLAFLMAGCSVAYQSPVPTTLDLMSSTVLINACGTGVIVETKPIGSKSDEVFILTASHVAGPHNFGFVMIFEHHQLVSVAKRVETYVAQIVARDYEADLALLRTVVPRGLARPVPIVDAVRLLTPGQKLWAIGCADAKMPTITDGVFGRWVALEPPQGLYTGGITMGNSGGGVYTEDGELVGITIGILKQRSHPIWHMSSFACVSQEVIVKLKKQLIHGIPKKPEPKPTKTAS